jgi:RNA polymerase sigma factor (sigma-70 family)
VDQGPTIVTDVEIDPAGTGGWDRLEEVYRREHAPMVRLAHLLVRDRAVAEELVQDAFLRLHAHLDRVDDPGGYLRTTVVNLCRGHGRRLETARRHESTLARLDRVEPPPLPPEMEDVWQALGRIPAKRREALVLRYYADLPTDEVARLLDTRPATARSLIRRGLESLKKELEP